jgi:hypothetical protein
MNKILFLIIFFIVFFILMFFHQSKVVAQKSKSLTLSGEFTTVEVVKADSNSFITSDFEQK